MTTTTQDGPASASTTNSGAGSGAGGGGRLDSVRQSAADAYEAARQRTAAAYSATLGTVGSAGRRTAEGIEANPMAAVIGGMAIGAVAAALLPRTRREEELLGPAGRRIADTGREAARAARDAAREQLDDLGLSRDGVRRRIDEFTDRAVGAGRTGSSGGGGSGGGGAR